MSGAGRSKRRLREEMRGRPAAGDAAAARAAQDRVLSLAEGARRVCAYLARGDEVPTARIWSELAGRGVALAAPRVEGCGLRLHRVDDPAALRPGHRGVVEPSADAEPVPADAPDLFVVPGLAFDRAGRRLGRGGGHYDRLLAAARPDALRVGLCWDARLVAELPEDPWDQRVHVVVTERGLHRAAAPAGGTRA